MYPSAYERGERNPSLEKLARICFALGVEAETFCGEVAQVEAGEPASLNLRHLFRPKWIAQTRHFQDEALAIPIAWLIE